MVLSDRTITRLLDEGRIEIDPYDDALLQPSSLDVRVDRYFRVFRNSRYPFIDVKQAQEELTELVEIDDETPFMLHPGEFVLGSTLERVRLPDDLVARLEGKSSLGRLGLLIHSTAGFIDPGWDGHVTLELSNVANLPITIYPGMKIGQVSFMQMSEPATTPYGASSIGSKYKGQKGPTPSRYFKDFERVMAQGTRDVVAAAKEAGVRRFVLASALGLDERTKDAVPYFAAKWEMERAVMESGLEYVILRPSFVFGKDGGVLPTFVRLARLAPVTPIVGPGTQRLQPIWVEDVAEYYAQSVDLAAAANRTFEVGGPDAPTWNEFWERLKRVLGARRPSVHIPFGVMRLQASILERLPNAPVTRDQLTMLALGDNIVTNPDAVDTFGLPLVPLDEQLRRAA